MIKLKTENDIKHLHISGKILAETLTKLKNSAKEGVTLKELDRQAQEHIKEAKAKPSFLGYKIRPDDKPYPAAICASVNEHLVHGIPSDYALKGGDILKIDCGLNYKGYVTDAAITLGIGEISEEGHKLIQTTKKALEEAIKVCKPGNTTGDIGWTVENVVNKGGFKVAERLHGHGVGFKLHEPPSVWNYGEKGTGEKLTPGLVIAIEPMVTTGSGEITENPDGSFTIKDDSLSAHFEKTIAITKDGHAILTPL